MLGVGRIVDKPWVVDGRAGRAQGRPSSSLTFDHRVCDGGTAGGFLRHVADCVERPAVLIAARLTRYARTGPWALPVRGAAGPFAGSPAGGVRAGFPAVHREVGRRRNAPHASKGAAVAVPNELL